MIWVTSDTHFNHLNILKYEPQSRPFETIEEMNEEIIKRWNDKIHPDDTVIHCGDFFMGPLDKIEEILSRLNGKIILVRGNHDSPNRLKLFEENGIEIRDIYYLSYKGRFFIFCHFPIDSEEFKMMVRKDNSEVILCYGHIHSNAQSGLVDGTYHVGLDTNNLTPVNLDDIWKLSREEEDKKEIPKIEDKECITCSNMCSGHCKGQDGGCLFRRVF